MRLALAIRGERGGEVLARPSCPKSYAIDERMGGGERRKGGGWGGGFNHSISALFVLPANIAGKSHRK